MLNPLAQQFNVAGYEIVLQLLTSPNEFALFLEFRHAFPPHPRGTAARPLALMKRNFKAESC